MKFILISGLSGAGKSKAASFLEDMGYYVVDNMPAAPHPQVLPSSAWRARVTMTGWRWSRISGAGQTFDGLFSL